MKRPILIRDSLIVAARCHTPYRRGRTAVFLSQGLHECLWASCCRRTVILTIRFEGERQDRLLADLPLPLNPGPMGGGILLGEKSKRE